MKRRLEIDQYLIFGSWGLGMHPAPRPDEAPRVQRLRVGRVCQARIEGRARPMEIFSAGRRFARRSLKSSHCSLREC